MRPRSSSIVQYAVHGVSSQHCANMKQVAAIIMLAKCLIFIGCFFGDGERPTRELCCEGIILLHECS